MLFYKYSETIEIVSGEWSGNTLHVPGGIASHLLIKSTSSSTVFDCSITDSDDNVIFKRSDVIGLLNEILELPVLGVCTLAITNSTVDENFNLKLMVKE